MNTNFLPEAAIKQLHEEIGNRENVEITFGLFADGKEEYTLITKDGEQPYKSNIYEIGSITKTVTGLLAARAILAGTGTDEDRAYLQNIEEQAQEIRRELHELDA